MLLLPSNFEFGSKDERIEKPEERFICSLPKGKNDDKYVDKS